MKNLKNSINKYPLLFSIFINLILFFIIYKFLPTSFQTVDDLYMLIESSGVLKNTEPSPYLLFSNIIIGYMLNILYRYFFSVPWYELYIISLLFLAFTSFLYVALRRKKNQIYFIIFYFLYFYFIGIYLLTEIQFTSASIILAFSGLLLMFSDFEKNLIAILVGNFLILLSSFVRFESFILALIIFIPVFIFIYYERGFFKIKKQIIILPLIILIALLLDFYSDIQHDKNAYGIDSFNRYKALLNDYNYLDNISTHEKEQRLNSVNWSENDYKIFRSWYITDIKIFNKVNLEKMTNGISKFSDIKIKGIFTVLLNNYLKDKFFILTIIISFLPIFFIQNKKELIIILSSLFFISVIIIASMIIFLKPPAFRVYFGIYSFIAIVPLFFMKVRIEQKDLKFFYSLIILFPIFYFHTKKIVLNSNIKKQFDNGIHIVLNQFDNKNTYINWQASVRYHSLMLFTITESLNNKSIINAGSFRHSLYNILSKEKIRDLQLEIINNPHYYITVKYPVFISGLYKTYMKEHYNLDIEYKIVKRMDGIVILKFYRIEQGKDI